MPCQQKYLAGGRGESQSSVWDYCQFEIQSCARLPTSTQHEPHMLVRAVVWSWVRVKGLDCINRKKTWGTIGGRKNKESKKCLPKLL